MMSLLSTSRDMDLPTSLHPVTSVPNSASSITEFVAHAGSVTCLCLGPRTGHIIASGSDDKTVNVWSLSSLAPSKGSSCASLLMTLPGHASAVEAIKFGRNEDILSSGCINGALKVWDVESAQTLRCFSGHKSSVTCIDFHPYGAFFASGSLDSNIKLWDTRKKNCMYAYKAHNKDVRCLRFSPDGRWLASGGDEGIIKVWDLAAGKVLAEFNEHVAPVTDLSFHPNELLLTSSSMDGTVKFWDLEAFTQVSSTANEAGPVHTISYNLSGTLLFATARDLLKSYQWEPARTINTLIVNWGRIKDTFVTDNFLLATSATNMSVGVFIVYLGKKSNSSLTPKSLSTITTNFQSNLSIATSPPLTLNSATSLTNISSSNVPSTAMINAAAAGLAHSASQVFHPSSHHRSIQNINLNEPPSSKPPPVISPPQRLPPIKTPPKVPPKSAVVFPEPQAPATSAKNNEKSDTNKQPSQAPLKSEESLSLFPMTTRDLHLNTNNKTKPVQNVAPSKSTIGPKVSSWNTNHHLQKANNSTTNPVTSTQTIPMGNKQQANSAKASAIIYPEQKKKVQATQLPVCDHPTPPSPPASLSSDERVDLVPESRDRPVGLDFDDFLPKHLQDTVRMGYHPQPEISETEAMTSIMKGHKSLVTSLSHRKKNVQIVLALWSSKDPIKALEQAIHFDDQSIIVDILNVINLKPPFWTLDVCQTLLPVIHELLQSKFESYMSVGCTSLKLILKNFASMIKTNITAPPGIGVDITREERYNKCLSCYNHLLSVRAFILKRQTLQGKLGRSFRELSILMQNLE